MAQAALDEQRGQIKPAAEIYTDILRRWPDFAPAQKRLATLYAQDPSATATAYDLAGESAQALPDDAELAELLGRLSYEKKEYQRAIQLLQESARKRNTQRQFSFLPGNVAATSQTKDRSTRSAESSLARGPSRAPCERSKARPRKYRRE